MKKMRFELSFEKKRLRILESQDIEKLIFYVLGIKVH